MQWTEFKVHFEIQPTHFRKKKYFFKFISKVAMNYLSRFCLVMLKELIKKSSGKRFSVVFTIIPFNFKCTLWPIY